MIPGWKDLLEEGQSTPVFLPGEFPWTEEPGRLQSMGLKELDMTEQLSTAQHIVLLTVVTMLYVGSPELNHLITES